MIDTTNEDAGTLLFKLDNLKFDLTLKEKELKNIKQASRKYKESNVALRYVK